MERFKKWHDPKELNPDKMEHNYNVDMSEEDREGDEMSGDEHSAGLQGEEPELDRSAEEISGIPGKPDTADLEAEELNKRKAG